MDIEVVNKIIETIYNSNKVAVLVHVNPDGDALGSGLAMYIALKQLKKEVDLIIPSYPKIYEFLPQINEIKSDTLIRNYDLCICLDCASKERLFEPKKIFENAKKTIVIDHHSSNTNYADINLVLGEEPACTQVLIYLFEKMGIRITKKIGECIAAGIITDTGGFKNNNVNAKTFEITSKLMNLGIDVAKVTRELLETKTRSQFELIKIVTNRIELYEEGQIAFAYITKEDIKNVGALEGEHEGLVDIGKSIKDVKVSIFIREDDKGYNVSFRSKNGINVREIAESFGGGGHTAASGCVINETLDVTRTKILERVRKSING